MSMMFRALYLTWLSGERGFFGDHGYDCGYRYSAQSTEGILHSCSQMSHRCVGWYNLPLRAARVVIFRPE